MNTTLKPHTITGSHTALCEANLIFANLSFANLYPWHWRECVACKIVTITPAQDLLRITKPEVPR